MSYNFVPSSPGYTRLGLREFHRIPTNRLQGVASWLLSPLLILTPDLRGSHGANVQPRHLLKHDVHIFLFLGGHVAWPHGRVGKLPSTTMGTLG